MIREVKSSDAKMIMDIYNHYIINTDVTFEEQPILEKEMIERIKKIIKNYVWLVYEEDNQIKGYAYASRWKERCAYKYSVESTVYVKPDSSGRGIGSKLYKELIERLRDIKTHLIVAGIALPNNSSENLHKKMGFTKCAHFSEVGFKNDRWIDVVYWELKL